MKRSANDILESLSPTKHTVQRPRTEEVSITSHFLLKKPSHDSKGETLISAQRLLILVPSESEHDEPVEVLFGVIFTNAYLIREILKKYGSIATLGGNFEALLRPPLRCPICSYYFEVPTKTPLIEKYLPHKHDMPNWDKLDLTSLPNYCHNAFFMNGWNVQQFDVVDAELATSKMTDFLKTLSEKLPLCTGAKNKKLHLDISDVILSSKHEINFVIELKNSLDQKAREQYENRQKTNQEVR